MSDYTYTVETLGDETLTDSIIMRTVTEVIDQHINTISEYAFYGCADLQAVIGTNVTSIRPDCFTGCTSLETVSSLGGCTEKTCRRICPCFHR